MRKSIMGCLGVVAAIFVAQFALAEAKAGECISGCDPCAEVACDPCEPICGDFDTSCDSLRDLQCDPCGPNLFGCKPKRKLSGLFLNGHLEGGVYVNEFGRKDAYSAIDGLIPGNTDYLQNVRQTSGQVNQLYIEGGKKLDTRRGWDWGAKAGYMFGTDARYAQSSGLEKNAGHGNYRPGRDGQGAWGSGDYYSAITEAYFEVGYNKLSVKAGKFFTPLGHEGFLSTDRFFYSLSDSFGLMPVTHSGALATWEASKRFSAYAGWVNGENKFFDTSDDNAFLGGFKYRLGKRVTLGYGVLVGTDDTDESHFDINLGRRGDLSIWNEGTDYWVQNFVVDVKLNKRWNYAFEWTVRNNSGGRGIAYESNRGNIAAAAWQKSYTGGYGINQELIYRANKKWAFGFRAEWVHNYASLHDFVEWDIFGNEGELHRRRGTSTDKYGFTVAANWTPNSWLTVRPELRYDKFDGRDNLFTEKGGKGRNKQLSGGVSAIVKY